MQTISGESRIRTEVTEQLLQKMARSKRWIFFIRSEDMCTADTRNYCVCPEKLGQGSNRTSANDSKTRPTHGQNVTLNLCPVCNTVENTQGCNSTTPDSSPRRDSFLFSAIVPKTVWYGVNQNHKLCVIPKFLQVNGKNQKIRSQQNRPTKFFSHIGLQLIQWVLPSASSTQNREYTSYTNRLSQTAENIAFGAMTFQDCALLLEDILSDELILLHLRLGDVRTRIWFSIAPLFAVHILLGEALIDRFIRGISSAERKIVQYNSQLVATVEHKLQNTQVNVVDWSTEEVKEDGIVIIDAEDICRVRVGCQVIFKPNT